MPNDSSKEEQRSSFPLRLGDEIKLTCVGEAASGWTLWKTKKQIKSWFLSKHENMWKQYCDLVNAEEVSRYKQELSSVRSRTFHLHTHCAAMTTHFRGSLGTVLYFPLIFCVCFFTLSKEYWQLAMTRQNWKTQKSLKQPWLRSTKPRKETRKAMKTATRFSRTSWFLYKSSANKCIYT